MIKTTIDSHLCIKLTNMVPCSSTILPSEFNKFRHLEILRIWYGIKTLRIRFLTNKSFVLELYAERLFKHNSQIFLMFLKYLIKIRIIWPLNIGARTIRHLRCMIRLCIWCLLRITIVWHCTICIAELWGGIVYELYVIVAYGGTNN